MSIWLTLVFYIEVFSFLWKDTISVFPGSIFMQIIPPCWGCRNQFKSAKITQKPIVVKSPISFIPNNVASRFCIAGSTRRLSRREWQIQQHHKNSVKSQQAVQQALSFLPPFFCEQWFVFAVCGSSNKNTRCQKRDFTSKSILPLPFFCCHSQSPRCNI